MKKIALLCCLIAALGLPVFTTAQTLPPLFTNSLVSTNWDEVEGFVYDATGQQYVWEKGGTVWVVDTNGNKLAQPLIDIHDEVGNWRDHGLNGFALDPNFRTNGYFYLYYTVDRHHLLYYGTPTYSPDSNWYFEATIARVTRYTASSATNFTTTVPNSRNILIGETKKTGMVVMFDTHSGGSLVFGSDGTLLVSTGDGASPATADSGRINPALSYWPAALADSMVTNKQNVGSYRAQLVDCLNGKILRIDPATGNGLPSNPFFDSSDVRAPRSRVWAMGLRNPFRVILEPGSGESDPTAGEPGTLYIGDVGWQFWEDINVCNEAGQNFGWPVYQGYDLDPNYAGTKQYNYDAPNPLFGGGCTKPFFTFHDLIQNPTANGVISYPNPCNAAVQVPPGIRKFVHVRPVIDFSHGNQSRTGIFSGNNAATIDIDSAASPVHGVRFGGYSSIAGFWYTGDKWPLQYQNSYYHGDYASEWIKQFKFTADDIPTNANHFADSVGAVVYMLQKNNDGCVYYVNYPFQIRKICYTGIVNNPPVAIATSNKTYGASPLAVIFNGSQSYDPTNDPLTYSWNFGDGVTATGISPSHTYTVTGIQNFWAVLTVSDNAGNSTKDSVYISVNNTPPNVDITSVNTGDLYSMLTATNLPLQATVTDSQHNASQLFYKWEVFLHHNTHFHPEAADTNKVTSAVITPIGCNGELYYYRIRLTVTDAAGLSSSDEVFIYPNCCQVGYFTAQISPAGPITFCVGAQVTLSVQAGTGYSYKWYRNNVLLAGVNVPAITVGDDGSYKCVVTSASCTATSNVVVLNRIVNPTPVITYTTPIVFCAPGTVTFTANTFTGVTYQWENNSLPIAGATAATYTATGTGQYRVLQTANGCSRYSNKVGVTAATAPVVAITASGPTTLCSGGTVPLSVTSPIPGYTYQWKKDGVNISGATTTGYAAPVSGNYSCSVTASCGTVNSNSVSVSIGSFSAQVTPSGNVFICVGGSILLSANTGAGFTYQWRNNGVNIPGAVSPTYSATSSGDYSVSVSSPCGSGISAATVVTQTSVSASITPSNPITVCTGTDVYYTANAGSGYTYRWFKNNVFTGITSINYGTSNPGSYKVEVSLNGACPVFSNTAVLTVINNPTPTLTAGGPLTFCAGQNVVFSTNTFAGVSYQWQKNSVNITGATLQNYTANSSGWYRCQQTANGCSKFTPKLQVVVNCRLGDDGLLFTDVSSLDNSMDIYPNPFDDKFSIQLHSPFNESAIVKVFDVLGKLQLTRIVSTNVSVEMETKLPAGVYVISSFFNNHTQTQKVVKMK